jgi:hypothetical protein
VIALGHQHVTAGGGEILVLLALAVLALKLISGKGGGR